MAAACGCKPRSGTMAPPSGGAGGLGATHTRSLAEARDKARSLRQLLLENVDPLEAREADRRAKLAEAARTKTFRQCAEAYLGLHADADGWSRRHLHQWR